MPALRADICERSKDTLLMYTLFLLKGLADRVREHAQTVWDKYSCQDRISPTEAKVN